MPMTYPCKVSQYRKNSRMITSDQQFMQLDSSEKNWLPMFGKTGKILMRWNQYRLGADKKPHG
jgi:hypothetical protein